MSGSEPGVSAAAKAPRGDSGSAELPPDVLERVFDSLPMGVVVFDESLRIVRRNSEARVLFSDEDNIATALARRSLGGVVRDWAVELRAVLSTRHHRRFAQVEYRVDPDQRRLLNLSCIPLHDAGHARSRAGCLLVEDVTAERGLEKRLAASERYAAVGKLAARVAHELNNPLDGILRYINLAERILGGGGRDKAVQYLGESRKGLMRMARIISDLLEYSRSAQAAFEDGGINQIVEDAVKAMEDKTHEHHVTVVCDLAPDMPRVHGASLFQVFCNLIKNAADAMPDGGRLMVTTRRDDRHAVILVEDTGVGLPDDGKRIFEPFYTTKGPGEGTGLGLAICRDFIEDKYHGTIHAENRAEGGARIDVRIPLEICGPGTEGLASPSE